MTTGVLRLSQSDCLKPRLNRGFDWPEFRERLMLPGETHVHLRQQRVAK